MGVDISVDITLCPVYILGCIDCPVDVMGLDIPSGTVSKVGGAGSRNAALWIHFVTFLNDFRDLFASCVHLK